MDIKERLQIMRNSETRNRAVEDEYRNMKSFSDYMTTTTTHVLDQIEGKETELCKLATDVLGKIKELERIGGNIGTVCAEIKRVQMEKEKLEEEIEAIEAIRRFLYGGE